MGIGPLTKSAGPGLFGSLAKRGGLLSKKPLEEVVPQHKKDNLSLFAGLYSLVGLFGILRNQVENFVTFGSRHLKDKDDNDGAISIYSKVLGLFVKPFQPTPDDFLEHKTADNPKGHEKAWMETVNPDVKENDPFDPNVPIEKRKLNFRGIMKRLAHPTVARIATSFVFGVQNILNNIFGNELKGRLGPVTSVLNFFNQFTSALAGVFAGPGTLVGSIFAFFGKQDLVQASSLWGLAGGVLMPICSNIGTLVKTMIAFGDKFAGKSFRESMKSLDLNIGHLFQGLVGGVLAPVALPGMMARVLQIVKNTREDLIPSVKAFSNLVIKGFHKFNLFRSIPALEFENKAERIISTLINGTKKYAVSWVEGFVNNPLFKDLIFKHIMPVDKNNRISLDVYRGILGDMVDSQKAGYVSDPKKYENFLGFTNACPEAKDDSLDRDPKNMLFGFIPKSEFLMEIYKLLGPLQVSLMMLPPIFTSFSDEEIQDHGILPMRLLDRAMGLVSGMLAIPNYLLFNLSTRLPQMMVYYYSKVQDYKKSRGISYDAMDSVKKLRDKLKSLDFIPFAEYVANVIDHEIIDGVYGDNLFNDPKKVNDAITVYFERSAFKQEYALEAPDAVVYIRNLMRGIINKFPALRASVDENNLSASQKGKQAIGKFLDKVQQIGSAIPGASLLLAPIFGLLKKPFELKFQRNKGPEAKLAKQKLTSSAAPKIEEAPLINAGDNISTSTNANENLESDFNFQNRSPALKKAA